MTRSDVVALLKYEQGERSLREFAIEVKCSAAYISDIYLNRRDPGPRILRYLGMKRLRKVEVSYVKGRSA